MTLYGPDGTTELRWEGPPSRAATVVEGKAATGIGVGFYDTGTPLHVFSSSPQDLMKQAQSAYRNNMWVGTAEDTINGRVVGLPWHLEDENGEEPDTTDAAEAKLLLEQPQRNIERRSRKPGTSTRRLMFTRTSRDLGLCGMAYWYADQLDVRGIPAAWLYINPARMWPAEDDNGNVTGWILDPKNPSGRTAQAIGGIPLELNEVLPFYLAPPDWGNIGSGVYERARLQVQVGGLAAQHAGYVLGTGGRIAGIVSPKEGTIPDDKFKVIVNEFRNLNERPDAAKRTTIMQGPMDFVATAADPEHLDLVNLAKMNRDDIFTNWGIPSSQAGAETPGGLNSGETKAYDEAILMQGAVHDRVEAIRETIQFGWLDKYEPQLQLIIEEPEFDDESPAYTRAKDAAGVPLTNAERRAIVGLGPTGDAAFDEAVVLPVNMVPYTMQAPVEAKASISEAANTIHTGLVRLRDNLEKITVPSARSAVDRVLEEQQREIIERVKANAAHIAAHPNDDAVWWNQAKWDQKLRAALAPEMVRVAEAVSTHIDDVLT